MAAHASAQVLQVDRTKMRVSPSAARRGGSRGGPIPIDDLGPTSANDAPATGPLAASIVAAAADARPTGEQKTPPSSWGPGHPAPARCDARAPANSDLSSSIRIAAPAAQGIA